MCLVPGCLACLAYWSYSYLCRTERSTVSRALITAVLVFCATIPLFDLIHLVLFFPEIIHLMII